MRQYMIIARHETEPIKRRLFKLSYPIKANNKFEALGIAQKSLPAPFYSIVKVQEVEIMKANITGMEKTVEAFKALAKAFKEANND